MTVLVTGMHRSGTSAVAAALRAAGLSGGDRSGSTPATRENPDGEWELESIRQFNDRLLASLGWTWDAPPAVPPSVLPQRASFVDEGRRLLHDLTPDGQVTFVSDPRISLLLPWWRRIASDRLVVVVSTRSRDEVAESLSVSNGFPAPLGDALAAAYDRHLAKGSAGLPVVIVNYRALTSDPKATVVDLLGRLRDFGIEGAYDEEAAAAAVKSAHRPKKPARPSGNGRGRVSPMPIEDEPRSPVAVIERFALEPVAPASWEIALLEAQRALHEERDQTVVAIQEAEEVRRAVDTARAAAMIATDERRAVMDRISELESQRVELQATIDELTADVDALRVHASKLEAQRDDLRATTAPLRADAAALRTWASTLEGQRDELRATTERLRADADALRTRAAHLEAHRDEVRGEADRLRRTIEELRTDREALRARASAIDAERKDLRKTLDEIRPLTQKLRAEGQALGARAAALEAERDQLQRTVAQQREEGEALWARASAERDELQRLTDELRVEGDALRTREQEREAERDELQRLTDELRVEGGTLRSRLHWQEAELDEVRRLAKRAARRERTARTRLQEREAERDGIRHLAERLRAEGEALSERATALEVERDQLQATADQLREGWEALRARASAERVEALRLADELRAEGEALRGRVQGLEAERDEVRHQADESRAEGETLRSRLQEQEAERDELALRLTAVERYGPIGSRLEERHPRIGRWLIRPLRVIWLLATFRLWKRLRDNPLFDPEWYRTRYPDIAVLRTDPRGHYWSLGAAEGRDPNPLFDTDWYVARYPDVAATDINPLDHYFYYGAVEGRSPSARFDSVSYLADNPDVKTMNPLLHYLRFGVREGRRIRPTGPDTLGTATPAEPGLS